MVWKLKEQLKEQLARETGYCSRPAGGRHRFALAYPNSYFVGMSNLGLHIVYRLLNERQDTACERVFLPEKKLQQAYEKARQPLMTLESQTGLNRFDLIGFVISFEMDYFNILRMLELGKVVPMAADRGEQDALVIGGGIAVAAAAPAAIGAVSEDPKSFSKALIFVALGEGCALYGFVVALLMLFI